ncbi:MAG: DegV family EDD domain-containing protein [FCB group bacterium]|nr:DegV family EDD domain-containing protein [FCB group bacterium]
MISVNTIVNNCRVRYLNVQRLCRILHAGFERVFENEESINAINIFPIPDRDTGTNLTLSFSKIVSYLKYPRENHTGRFLTEIAQTALDHASGNAGAIMAHLFLGISLEAKFCQTLDASTTAAAIARGTEEAIKSVQTPVQGTILTVMEEFSKQLSLAADSGVKDILSLFEAGLTTALAALANTTAQLDILKKAGVVDAGGRGFVHFLEGIADFMRNGNIRTLKVCPESPISGNDADANVKQIIYCAECTILQPVNRAELERKLENMGEKMFVTGPKSEIKVHLHTSDPEQFFKQCSRYGTVSSKRSASMPDKYSSLPLKRKTIAIVTDSIADFPSLDFSDIYIVPVRFSFGKESYIDKISLTTSEFYRELQTNPIHPKTSQPVPGDFRKVYQYLLEHYTSIISIHLAEALSGTLQSARHAINQIPNQCIDLLDSSTVSVSQGLLVMAAVEAIKAGKSHEFVVNHINSLRPKTRLFAALSDLNYIVKGGRIPEFVNSISKFLHLKPVLSTLLNGKLVPIGVLPGGRNVHRKLCGFLLKRINTCVPYRAIVGHSNSPELGQRMLTTLKEKLPSLKEVSLVEIGGGLGVHTGPGAIAVGIQEIIPL